jgi:hypothetical protein
MIYATSIIGTKEDDDDIRGLEGRELDLEKRISNGLK